MTARTAGSLTYEDLGATVELPESVRRGERTGQLVMITHNAGLQQTFIGYVAVEPKRRRGTLGVHVAPETVVEVTR